MASKKTPSRGGARAKERCESRKNVDKLSVFLQRIAEERGPILLDTVQHRLELARYTLGKLFSEYYYKYLF